MLKIPIKRSVAFCVVLGLAFALGAAETPSTVVTMPDDVVDPDDRQISLREAIAYAGTGKLGTTITFAIDAEWGSVANYVSVTGTLAVAKSLVIESRDLSSGLTMEYGSNIQNAESMFKIAAGVRVVFNGGEFRANIDGEGVEELRGGAFHNLGDLTLKNASLVYCRAGWGGCVANEGSLRLENCTLSHNSFVTRATALYNQGSAICISCKFSENDYGNWDGELHDCEAILNRGTMRLEQCVFAAGMMGVECYARGMFTNEGTAVFDGVCFTGFQSAGYGSVIANGGAGRLQVNNASFYLNDSPMISCAAGGDLQLLNSSFSNNSHLQYADHPEDDPANWGYDDTDDDGVGEDASSSPPCVQIEGTANDLRVYNCAFDMARSNAFAGTVSEMRGCAFTTASLTNLFATARIRRMGDVCAYNLMPTTNLVAAVAGVPLRKDEGVLAYFQDETWTTTPLEIPHLKADSLALDMFGDSRTREERGTCVSGATADPNGPEGISSRPTTEQDIVDPYDGLISLREALAYAPYVGGLNPQEGGANWIEIELGGDSKHYRITNGPIVVDLNMDTVGFVGYGAILDGCGVSGILELKGCAYYELHQVKFSNASGSGNGGAVNITSESTMDMMVYECAFTNCATSGSGGAIFIPERVSVRNFGGVLTFDNCRAGRNGGAIACEGSFSVEGDGCRFSGCSAKGRGGAAYLRTGNLAEVQFQRNQADEGGALWAEQGSYCRMTFTGNSATSRGGALAGTLSKFTEMAFVDNHAPEGSAIYLSGDERKIGYNLSFFGNTGPTATVMASDDGTLRLANCDAWNNGAANGTGAFAAGVNGTKLSVFNSILPEQSDDGTLIKDAVTRLDFAADLGSVLLCENNGSPCLFRYYYEEQSDGSNYGHLAMRYTSLVARHDVPAAGVGTFTAADGKEDLAYYDRQAEAWRDADGNVVDAEVWEVSNDLRGKGRGDKSEDGANGYGLGSLAHCAAESQSRIITTLVDSNDPQDMRVSMREAFNNALKYWNLWRHYDIGSPNEVTVSFDLASADSRTVNLVGGVMALVTSDSYFTDENGTRLVLDGACADGSRVIVDLNGGSLFLFEDEGLKNNFGFRNLVFRNAVIPSSSMTAGIFECLSTEGSMFFENCVFENCRAEGDWPGVVKSGKPVAFTNCVFTACAGGSGAVVACANAAVEMENCVIEGTSLYGWDVVKAGTLRAHNLTVRGTEVDKGVETIFTLFGSGTNTLLNVSFVDTTWLGSSTGCVVTCESGVTDFGNLSSGGNGGGVFLRLLNDAQARILNGLVEGSCKGAAIGGAFRSGVGPLAESTYSDFRHAAVTPLDGANPGSPVGVYELNGVPRLAVLENGVWKGADGTRLASAAVRMEELDLFGVSRLRGDGTSYYTCGALSEYMPDLVVTTANDVVDPSDGQTSFREAVQALIEGQRRLNGERKVSFAIAGTRNPVIRWSNPFVVTNAEVFNASRPLIIDGSNGKGQVTFDGEGARSLFRVGNGAVLELANCTLANGSALYGGAVRADGGSLGLRGVTVRDSYASAMGGGVWGGDVWAQNCTFTNCVSENGGGAIGLDAYGSLLAENCAFAGNAATVSGGAVYGRAGVGADLSRCSFRGNRAFDGAAICVGAMSEVEVGDSVFSENQVEFAYSGVVYGENAAIDLDSVTSWGNLRTGVSAPASLLETWGGTPTISASLVGEPKSSITAAAVDAHTVFGLDEDSSYFEVSNGVPFTAQAKVYGVAHVYRRPSAKAVYSGVGALGLDLFGNARTNYTLGAVGFLSEPPVEEVVEVQITHPDFRDGVDLDAVEAWVAAQGVDVEELNESEQALASFILNTPLLTAPAELTITQIEEDAETGFWLVTVHAEATYAGSEHGVALGEQVGNAPHPLINGKLTVSRADSLSGPWTEQTYDLANLEFTPAGDAIVTVKSGRFFRAVITK